MKYQYVLIFRLFKCVHINFQFSVSDIIITNSFECFEKSMGHVKIWFLSNQKKLKPRIGINYSKISSVRNRSGKTWKLSQRWHSWSRKICQKCQVQTGKTWLIKWKLDLCVQSAKVSNSEIKTDRSQLFLVSRICPRKDWYEKNLRISRKN